MRNVAVEPPRKPLVEYILFWQNWISYPKKILIDTLAASLTFLTALIAFFWRPKLMNRVAIAMLLLTIIGGASAAYDWYRFDLVDRGVVIKDGTVARKGDAEGYAEAFTKPLPEGAEFLLQERRGDWILIELPGAQEGWIQAVNAVVY